MSRKQQVRNSFSVATKQSLILPVASALLLVPLFNAYANANVNASTDDIGHAISENVETRSNMPQVASGYSTTASAQDPEASQAAPIIAPRLTPFSLVSQLDLECRSAEGKPPVEELRIRQLNPVIQEQLPDQHVKLGELKDVCVPVAKNGQIPDPRVRRIVQWVDLACYKAEAEEVSIDLEVSHLNPVLAELPREHVALARLSELCVPVLKNDSRVPKRVRKFVEHVDIACYELREPTQEFSFPLVLSHLNPVIRKMGLEDHEVKMHQAYQLCVPVGKNDQKIPDRVQHFVQWIDFLRYKVSPSFVQDLQLVLSHLNPLFAESDRFDVKLGDEMSLLVPVAKNGVHPPSQ